MATRKVITTQVAIMGAGPAGLMLSHLLAKAGIDSTVIEVRSHKAISETVRAGILEHGTVNSWWTAASPTGCCATATGTTASSCGSTAKATASTSRNSWGSPSGCTHRRTCSLTSPPGGRPTAAMSATASRTPLSMTSRAGRKSWFTDADGVEHEIQAEFVVGADGSRSHCRVQIPEAHRKWYFHEYPFAWFGILAEAPRSSDELIYANSDNGFALISQRTETVQRMYFQCDPKENVADWDDDRIWAEFRSRVNGNGFELKEGPVIDRMVLPFRSFVHAPMRHGNLFLAGDAAHTVPPTGAKGLNLAIHDVKVLFEGLDSYYNSGSTQVLDSFSDRALKRVWKAQQFSYWMTTMLHTPVDADNFSRARQLGELNSVVASRHGMAYLAEAYTGWPSAG